MCNVHRWKGLELQLNNDEMFKLSYDRGQNDKGVLLILGIASVDSNQPNALYRTFLLVELHVMETP